MWSSEDMHMQPEQLSSHCCFAAGKNPLVHSQIFPGTRDQPYGYFGPDLPQSYEMPNSGIWLTVTIQSKAPGLIYANSVCWGRLG